MDDGRMREIQSRSRAQRFWFESEDSSSRDGLDFSSFLIFCEGFKRGRLGFCMGSLESVRERYFGES